jgi:hypothetical protein
VAVILHERLANWARQLRPRLESGAIRWFETRSRGDLEAILPGLACPVVLIDLGQRIAAGLNDLVFVREHTPDARVLVIDPGGDAEVRLLARELGATHVFSGFIPPPAVADLVARWVDAAARRALTMGWSRTAFPATGIEPWGWLEELLELTDDEHVTTPVPGTPHESNLP